MSSDFMSRRLAQLNKEKAILERKAVNDRIIAELRAKKDETVQAKMAQLNQRKTRLEELISDLQKETPDVR